MYDMFILYKKLKTTPLNFDLKIFLTYFSFFVDRDQQPLKQKVQNFIKTYFEESFKFKNFYETY